LALDAIAGKKRLWLLGDPDGAGNLQVVGFVAACVIGAKAVEVPGEGWTLEVLVQPCVQQTATARVRAASAANPFVGKVSLYH
jgi:hypothetical protein